MKKSIIILFVLAGCTKVNTPAVNISGNLQSIMMKNMTEATIDLRDLKEQPNLYALGAAEGLKGEILVMNSSPLVARVAKDTFSLSNNFEVKATLLVSATVKEWRPYPITENMDTNELTAFVKTIAKDNQLEDPFPFIIKGIAKQVNWHIVNGNSGSANASHDDHAASGFSREWKMTPIEILGFYSETHQGVFTHHDQDSHMHFKTQDGSAAGHVDDLQIEKGWLRC